MPTITVKAPFRLNLSDGTYRDFKPGTYEVDDETAEHWYVQAHSDLHPAQGDDLGLPDGDDPPFDEDEDEEGDGDDDGGGAEKAPPTPPEPKPITTNPPPKRSGKRKNVIS